MKMEMFKSWIKEISDTFKEPWHEPAFVLYFIFIIIGFSAIGVYLSIIYRTDNESLVNIAQNIMTYAVSISVPSVLNIFLKVIPLQKHQVSNTIISIGLLLILIISIFFAFSEGNMLIAILGSILAWIYWIIANSKNETFGDKTYSQEIKKEVNKHGKNWD